MLTTSVWRLLLLIVFFGITNMTWGQHYPHDIPIEDPHQEGSFDSEEDEKRMMFCDNNVIDNGNFEAFGSLSGNICDPGFQPNTCSANLTFNCTSNRAPFHSCGSSQVGDWWISHGTPEIWRSSGGDEAALLWSGRFNRNMGDNNIYGEGLFNYCFEFKEGLTYNLKISMRRSGLNLTNVFMKLANDIDGPSDYSNPDLFTVNQYYLIPDAVGPSQTVFTSPGFSSSAFTSFEVTFTPDQDYNFLWIYPYQNDPAGGLSLLYIDDICLSCVNHEDVVIYTESSALPDLTSAYNLVNAKEEAAVYTGDEVTFISEEEILLQPDFLVEPGGIFNALIEPLESCNQFICATANTFTDDNDGDQRASDLEIDTPDQLLKNIKVFPNPGTGLFHISIPSIDQESSLRYTIMSTLGEVLLQKNELNEEESFDLSSYPPGVYFLQIYGEGFQVTKRLILQ